MDGDDADDARMEQMRNMRAAHVLQLAFRALQPGLLLVSGPDLERRAVRDRKTAISLRPGRRTASKPDRPPVEGLPVAVQIYPPGTSN